MYGQWLHRSKLNHAVEALGNNSKKPILDADIPEEHERGQNKVPYIYITYFHTPLSVLLDTTITEIKKSYRLIKTTRKTTGTDEYTIFYSSKPLRTWVGV